MCVFCAEHNERASCFYRKMYVKWSNSWEIIEYVPNYGFIMPGVLTTNGRACLIFEHLQPEDQAAFAQYLKETLR